MILLAIDPGPVQSALVEYDTELAKPVQWVKCDNDILAQGLVERTCLEEMLAIEMIASYGMPVGAEVFETCVWIGRFIECWGWLEQTVRITRGKCKLHLCHSVRAADSHVRQALIDRYGPGKDRAIGLKASPGPLYGMSGDCWAALAVAVTVSETILKPEPA